MLIYSFDYILRGNALTWILWIYANEYLLCLEPNVLLLSWKEKLCSHLCWRGTTLSNT
ncbi:hypothetical protein M6B38_279590 [Iris pallida]|uniref:Uncharacterized protein n=1 Tax=Iris pallida TaxID=29817 RepID=A0AAX6I0H1_IRIPA|nr:hypothetical protein M6B38_279590 [Iris pallida]